MRNMRGHKKHIQAARRDLEFLDLVKFIPGSPISALANMTACNRQAVESRARILQAAGFVEFNNIGGRGERSTKVIYPV